MEYYPKIGLHRLNYKRWIGIDGYFKKRVTARISNGIILEPKVDAPNPPYADSFNKVGNTKYSFHYSSKMSHGYSNRNQTNPTR
jgi:hypothetical protein